MYRQELELASPWINATGTLGFAPPQRWMLPEPMGAFVTNPVSLLPRTPAGDRTLAAYPGGYLLHSGHPNPGLNRVLKLYAERWAQSTTAVWVHLLATHPAEMQKMVQRLEGVEGVMAVEIGLPPGVRDAQAMAYVEAAYGELPLIVNLPLTAAEEPWLKELPSLGVSAISLGAPRGMLADGNGRQVSGRLYGPGLLPQSLSAVNAVRRLGVQVIAGAGIFRPHDGQALLAAGAYAVQLDGVLWRGWAGDPAAAE
jgi:dihydroorotate dehydrogenase (NAD+) catalytic subunit